MPGFGKIMHGHFLDWLTGTGSPTTPDGVIHVGLSEADAGTDGQSNNEPSGGSYGRVATDNSDWNAGTDANPAVLDNGNPITFTTASADWASGNNLTHYTLWRHTTNTAEADYIGCGLLSVAKPVTNGDTASLAAGDCNIEFESQ